MGLKLKWTKGTAVMSIEDGTKPVTQIPVSNKVRARSKENPEDIVYTIPGKRPYMPTGFPVGTWKVTGATPKTDPYLYPFYIATDAWQMVPEWTVEADGTYGAETGKQVRDSGYGIHHSTSSTTLGCLKVNVKTDLEALVALVTATLARGEPVTFEVAQA